jgi:hypothetical protein
MATTVQVRLNGEALAEFESLRRQGLTASEVLREGIHLVAKKRRPVKRPKLIGVGMFDSGISDLSTNKKYMEGFGLTGPAKRKLDAERPRKRK